MGEAGGGWTRRWGYTPVRPWAPLSDAEWDAVAPFFTHAGPGRPVRDLRGRVDACFFAVTSGRPWDALSFEGLRMDTVARQFRRWAQAGVWSALLRACAEPRAGKVLRGVAYWVCRAFRRAWRVLGVAGVALARRLGMASALRAPSWLLPDPDLSRLVFAEVRRRLAYLHAPGRPDPRARPPRAWWVGVQAIIRVVGGRVRIPRCLEPA